MADSKRDKVKELEEQDTDPFMKVPRRDLPFVDADTEEHLVLVVNELAPPVQLPKQVSP